MALSDTRLKNKKHMLEYVQIEGYYSKLISRERWGGGVAVTVKTVSSTKFVNLDSTSRHSLPTETKIQLCRSILYNTSKTGWLDKFDAIMGQVLIKWDSAVILCGDMNIDIIKVNDPAYRLYRDIFNDPAYRLYRDILKGHGLTQPVTQPSRNNHAILDHITTNTPSTVE